MGNKKAIHLGEEYYSLMRSLRNSWGSKRVRTLVEDLAKSIYDIDPTARKQYFIHNLKSLVVGQLGSMVHCFIPFEKGKYKMEVEIRCMGRQRSKKASIGWSVSIKNDTFNNNSEFENMYTQVTYINHKTNTTKICRIPWSESELVYVK